MLDELDPGQPFLRINILSWREIFRVVETSGSNIDLLVPFVVLIGQRRSTAIAKRPPRSCLRLISAWRSLFELELRASYCNPRYSLGSGGSPAVFTMTICPNTNLGRRAETHMATITAPSNFIFFHVGIILALSCLDTQPRFVRKSASLNGFESGRGLFPARFFALSGPAIAG
jgi:hypothetical protein